MKILIIGNGGREHAIIQKLFKEKTEIKIYCAPGIDAIEDKITNVPIEVLNLLSLVDFAKSEKINLTVVGPEAPLVAGIVDLFEKNNLNIFGPSQKASQLEESKAFSKNLMKKYNIPTANYKIFTDYKSAFNFLKKNNRFPIVLKASGLAAGKGVVIPETMDEALLELKEIMLDKKFGSSGEKIVIEEFLSGEEASIFAICDGKNFVSLSPAQDHKRIGEDDTGKNTGGMGAYSPATIANKEVIEDVEDNIIKPLLLGMEKDGIPYKGVLFCGLMIEHNKAKVIEFNIRFGDPETQVVLPLIKSSFIDLLIASTEGNLSNYQLNLEHNKSVMTVVIVSGGYPDSYEKGIKISGLKEIQKVDILHAGTKKNSHNVIITNGGRVLNLVSSASTLKEAAHQIYSNISQIHFTNSYFRKDIGLKELRRKK